MKIVVDDKIPYIREALAQISDDVVYLPGIKIGADDVRDADALIVRTRTQCNEQLLSGSKVSFVATATIGFDHIDAAYMQRAGIKWVSCPGCNADSVAQYMESALLLLQREKEMVLSASTIGIVGCGHVGSRVKAVCEKMGMHVLVCDPPLAQQQSPLAQQQPPLTQQQSPLTQQQPPLTQQQPPLTQQQPPLATKFVSFEELSQQSDIITFHVPLTREAPYRTYHMADEDFFARLTRVPYIINTSRGEVVDNDALLQALRKGKVRDAILDVWEGEPQLNQELLHEVFIGTPHIAGYSADGKVNADNMVVAALCEHFHVARPSLITPPALPSDFHYNGSPLDLYNPFSDSEPLKQHPELFEQLRNNYPVRREKYTQKTKNLHT